MDFTSTYGPGPFFQLESEINPKPSPCEKTTSGGECSSLLTIISSTSNSTPTRPCSGPAFNYTDFTQLASVRYSFVIAYIVIILLSLGGNLLVILTVWRNKHMRTVTNCYIFNLAVCDLLVALTVAPFKLLEFAAPCSAWDNLNADLLCSISFYVLPVFVFASVLTLVTISLERFYAIVYPLNAMALHSKSRTKKILVGVWTAPLIVALPYVFCQTYDFNVVSHLGSASRRICTDNFDLIDVTIYGNEAKDSGRFRRGYFFFLFVGVYVIPSVIIVITCALITLCLLKGTDMQREMSQRTEQLQLRRVENKRKVAKMIIVISVAFIVSWTPFYLVSFISQLQNKNSFLRDSNFLFTMLLCHLFGFFNSCINPLVYNTMSRGFRKSFRSIVHQVVFCVPFNSELLQKDRGPKMVSWRSSRQGAGSGGKETTVGSDSLNCGEARGAEAVTYVSSCRNAFTRENDYNIELLKRAKLDKDRKLLALDRSDSFGETRCCPDDFLSRPTEG